MTTKERKYLSDSVSAAWETLKTRQYQALVSNLPRGCGYDAAQEYIDSACATDLEAWVTLHMVCEHLGVEWQPTPRAVQTTTRIWCYTEGKKEPEWLARVG